MKSILYVGATLMIGASIYGFVDYKQTSQKKGFTGMYQAEEEKVIDPPKDVSTVKEKKPILVEQLKKTTGKIKDPVPAKTAIETTPLEKIGIAAVTINTSTVRESSSVKNLKKKRRLTKKLFSRAPLKDDYISAEVVIQPVRLDAPKKEKKDQ
jgi:hypothetical protein